MSSCGKTYSIRREYSTVQQLSGTLSGRIRASLVEYIMTEMSASKYIAQGESLEEKLLQKERWFLFHESVTGQKSQISNPILLCQTKRHCHSLWSKQRTVQPSHAVRSKQQTVQPSHAVRMILTAETLTISEHGMGWFASRDDFSEPHVWNEHSTDY